MPPTARSFRMDRGHVAPSRIACRSLFTSKWLQRLPIGAKAAVWTLAAAAIGLYLAALAWLVTYKLRTHEVCGECGHLLRFCEQQRVDPADTCWQRLSSRNLEEGTVALLDNRSQRSSEEASTS